MAHGNSMVGRTKVERASDCELLVTRIFDAPPHIVFAAWTTPDLFRRWWAPHSMAMSLLGSTLAPRLGAR